MSEWISVKDRLPDDEEQDAHGVLIHMEVVETYGKHNERKTKWHDIFVGYYDSGEWQTSYCYGCEDVSKAFERFPNETYEVTHWMPLPEPPKEKTI